MTQGDDAAGPEPRDVVSKSLAMADIAYDQSGKPHARRYFSEVNYGELTQEFIASLHAAGFQITPRRSEPMVEISVEDACNFEGAMSKNWDVDYTALHRLREALARATGDENERYG
jgi:hypothetical protein